MSSIAMRYTEDRQVMHALKLFSTIPYNLMEEYLRKKNNSPGFEPKESLKRLINDKSIYYSSTDKCYRGIDRYPKQINKICALAAYMHFCKNAEEKIEFARYPFDYIFEDNKRLFQLIDYSEDGAYKLRFHRAMEVTGDTDSVIPIIMLINSGLDSISDMNSDGNYTLIPREDYRVAFVTYKPGIDEPDYVSVVSKRYRGGSFEEY